MNDSNEVFAAPAAASRFSDLRYKIKWYFEAKKRNTADLLRNLARKLEPYEGNYINHAKRELRVLGYDLSQTEEDPNKWIQENLFELLDTFGRQGHSGSSAPYCINTFAKLALFKPLAPLTGAEDEWGEPYEKGGTQQNKRCSHVFRDADGQAYDVRARIFREPNGACYTGKGSRVDIEFPYTPSKEYVDVDKNGDPL